MDNYDIFHIENNHLSPERGKMLISEPFLSDKYFGRSVVLLVDIDRINGSMGFVVNKQLTHKLSDFLPEYEEFPSIPIFQGGPVESNKLFFIHSLGDIIPNAKRINKKLYFNGDFKMITDYIKDGNPVRGKIKFFLGYSGWEKGQLEAEISRNSWIVSEFKEKSAMEENGESCWKNILIEMGDKYKSWANFPRLPYLN